MIKRFCGVLFLGAVLVLSGCGGSDPAAGDSPPVEPSLTPTPTPLQLAPTLPVNTLAPPTPTPTPEPTLESDLAPTVLPDPTQIVPATATPRAAGGDSGPSTGPGISLSPAIGAAGEITTVTGSGFPAGDSITLHWAPSPSGPLGPVYWETETDERGGFQVGLIVLPADRWPDGPPGERDPIYLIAKSRTLGDDYSYFAQFVHISRPDPVMSLVLTYTNEDFGYSIGVPNGWTWEWTEDDTSDVRFRSPVGTGNGFVLVRSGTDVSGLIPTVMSARVPGQTYTTGEIDVGSYPGTKVTAANGRVVLFIPSGGRTYVLSFIDDNSQPSSLIHSSFRLR